MGTMSAVTNVEINKWNENFIFVAWDTGYMDYDNLQTKLISEILNAVTLIKILSVEQANRHERSDDHTSWKQTPKLVKFMDKRNGG